MRLKRSVRQFAKSSVIFTFHVWAKRRRKFIDSFNALEFIEQARKTCSSKDLDHLPDLLYTDAL